MMEIDYKVCRAAAPPRRKRFPAGNPFGTSGTEASPAKLFPTDFRSATIPGEQPATGNKFVLTRVHSQPNRLRNAPSRRLPWIAGALVAASLIAPAGCTKPPQEPQQANQEGPKPSTAPAATEPDSVSGPASEAARILGAAHRGGSLVYRSECGEQGRFIEIYPLKSSVPESPMGEALNGITRLYPDLRWKESAGRVRIVDRSARAGLLRVRIPEFTVIDDRDPDDALTTIWKTPEVRAFVKKSGVAILPPPRRAPQERRTLGPAVVHLKDAAVAEILDAMLASYKDHAPRLWIYRECRARGRTTVQVSVR